MTILKAGAKGFDISHHQDISAAEMTQAKEAGYSYVIIRSSHGMDSVDRKFEEHYAAAIEAGLYIGVYHFFYYASIDKFKAEVANFLRTIAGKKLNLPAFIDFENRGEYTPKDFLGSLDVADVTARAAYACTQIQDAGFVPGIYADADWLSHKMNIATIVSNPIVWVADWHGVIDYTGRKEIHQYTSTGTIPGIGNGSVDCEVLLVDLSITAEPATPTGGLAVDGIFKEKSISRWQEVMNTPITGEYSQKESRLIMADQTFLNYAVDPGTMMRLIGKKKLKVDGDNGPQSTKVRQWYLFNTHRDFFRAAREAEGKDPNTDPNTVLDGIAGPITNRVFQMALNQAVSKSGNY